MLTSFGTPVTEDNTYEAALEVLDRIWPQYDTKGYGIMAIDMEKVLHHVESELGTSLLDEAAWSIFREYVARVQGTIVNQKDLAGLLGLVHGQQQQIRMQMQQQQQLLQQQQHFASLQDTIDHGSHVEQDELLPPQYNHHHLDERQHPEDAIHQTGSAVAAAPGVLPTAVMGTTSAPLSPLACRPRSSAPIRRIALQTSSSYPRYRSNLSTSSLTLDTDVLPTHHHTSPGLDFRSTSSGRSPSPIASVHSTEEFEGYGLDAEPDRFDKEDFIRMKEFNEDLNRKLKRAQQDYAMRSDEQTKENRMHQEEIERLNQTLKTTRKEITELKYTEKSQSAQIEELEYQIQLNEKTSQTQKSGAVALKMQRDELEMENRGMKKSLREKEAELDDLVRRLKALEEESHKMMVSHDQMKDLQEQLDAEISKNQAMARVMEAMHEERTRLQDKVDYLGGSGGLDLNLTVFTAGVDLSANADPEAKSLWSELSRHRKEFDKPLESEPATPSAAVAPESLGAWEPEDAVKLIQESSQNSAQFATFKKKYEMKRSSIRDISQLYQDHAARLQQGSSAGASQSTQQDTPSASQPTTTEAAPSSSTETQRPVAGTEGDQQALEVSSQKKSVAFDTDDVDCALPDQLPPLGVKLGRLEQENRITDSLIGDILDQIGPLSITPTPAPFHRIHRESMRRRKPQASRAVTQAELDELRGEGTIGATTVQSPGETSTKVARRENSTKVIANVTLVSMYTIVVYLFGVITSVFLVDSNHGGRQFHFDALQAAAHQDLAGHGGRAVGFRLVEVFALWINNLISQGDSGYGST